MGRRWWAGPGLGHVRIFVVQEQLNRIYIYFFVLYGKAVYVYYCCSAAKFPDRPDRPGPGHRFFKILGPVHHMFERLGSA